ncbi:type VI secretion system protein TssR domain-containing protein [Geofilum rhodophaeum]|uniref:type VI secretion system protein TssR domain-containing protein n=1 Tax=Geofilum rhodophaeum TaxID=1965019 RepID=UPI000B52646B|nr:type VI secretion system protein TssR domain-containing protein [Geofilum rhodophaeum]
MNAPKLYLLLIVSLLAACAPVNRLTRLTEIPREHSMNYCATDLKAPKSVLNKSAWVVYSDRDNNVSYRKPGSRHKQKDLNFMEAFLVIGQKGDFLQLIKYQPDIIKDDQLTDFKKAEYYGWIHQSRMLLSASAATNTSNNLSNKHLLALTDTTAFQKTESFFIKDSIRLFKDPNLRIEHQTLPLHELVYLMKYSDDGKKVLLSRKESLLPEEAENDILGWVNKTMVQSLGQQLFWDMKPILAKLKVDDLWMVQPDILPYYPVFNRQGEKDSTIIQTGFFMPIVDKTDNFVFNVNGSSITYRQSKKIKENLQKINIVFVIEAGAETLDKFPTLVNAMQNMQTLLESKSDEFNYQYASVISMGDQEQKLVVDYKPFSPDFASILEALIARSANIESYLPLKKNQAWHGLEKGIELCNNNSEATHVIILLGETGNDQEWPEEKLGNNLANFNCRLLGLQMYAGHANHYNNFVIQTSNLIKAYAPKVAKTKREVILFPSLIKEENAFKESHKNAYMLDFPDRSMTQGAILFPEKEQSLSLDLITSAIDTFLIQVKSDNNLLVQNLNEAFKTFGSHRDKYDQSLSQHFSFATENSSIHEFKSFFSHTPGWFLRSSFSVSDSVFFAADQHPEYYLLLSGVEYDNLLSFMEKLTAFELEKKEKLPLFRRKSKNTVATADCDCEELQRGSRVQEEEDYKWRYRSTRKTRKDIQDLLLTELQENSYDPPKQRHLKKQTLKAALNTITNSPNELDTSNPVTIKSLSKKRRISDERLELLLEYFNLKKLQLENGISEKNKFQSLEQEYFWINSNDLP